MPNPFTLAKSEISAIIPVMVLKALSSTKMGNFWKDLNYQIL